MPRAVRFDEYGDVSVLRIEDVPAPSPGPGQALVEVVASSINPGENSIRLGLLAERFPATFPSGQGSDFAGRIIDVGEEAAVEVGTEVMGFTDERGAQADYVVVPADHLTPKPASLDWNVAGALFVAGTTAYAGVRAVRLQRGETVAVSAAAGGVGSLVVQLARQAGAHVIGIAGPGNAEWLESKGVTAVAYGDGLQDRLSAAAPDGLDAFIDNFGEGYVDLAVDLGIAPDRINTIIDFAAVEKFGVHADGSATASSATVLAGLADLAASGDLEVPVAAVYPLEQVRAAYTALAERHLRGKIVLRLR